MNIQEFYKEIGSDYEEVVKRFGAEALVARFVIKFTGDPTFGKLEAAFAAGDQAGAFRAAHTLKGVAQNLGFTNLGKSAAELTEVLRARTFSGSDELYEKVKSDYDFLIAALKEFAES